MQLKFSWRRFNDELLAVCDSDVLNVHGNCLVCSLLTDNGGLSSEFEQASLLQGLGKVDAVLSKVKTRDIWDREVWGAEIGPEEAKIYAISGDDEEMSVSTLGFRKALSAWMDFVRAPPDGTKVSTIEI